MAKGKSSQLPQGQNRGGVVGVENCENGRKLISQWHGGRAIVLIAFGRRYV